MDVARLSRISWILDNYCIKGEPISLAEYPYLTDIYMDESQKIVIKKSAQCGGSEWLIADSLYLCGYLGLTIAYYFPHQTQGNDFSLDRIDKSIDGSPNIKELASKGVDNVKLKQIGKGSLYIRGTDSTDNVVNVACDCIIRDEEDLMNPDVVPLTEERLGASRHKLIRVISNPTGPGRGIDKLYNESNRMRWFVKCEYCNEWQALKFPDSIDFENKTTVCIKCRKEIDRLARGEWVAESPDISTRGYHINQLINPRVTIESIIEKSKKTSESEIQVFYNMTLGEARAPKGQQFNEAMVLACCEPHYIMPEFSQEPTTAGIDVGNLFNIRISQIVNGRRKAVFIGETPHTNDVISIMRRYNTKTAVIDALPEKRVAKEIADSLKGKVYLAYFNDGQKNLIGVSEVDGYPSVNIARTEIMDLVFNEYLEHNNVLPENIQSIKNYIPHLLASVRRTAKDKYGNDKPAWEDTGADHYFLAEVYDRAAYELYGQVLQANRIPTKVVSPQKIVKVKAEVF